MADARGLLLTPRAARQLREKLADRDPVDLASGRRLPRGQQPPETIYARLTDVDSDGLYTWAEQLPQADGGWTDGPRSGSPDDDNAARGLAGPLYATDQIVLLRRAAFRDGDDADQVEWRIVSAPAGTLFPVQLAKDGGADGDATVPTACTYTYAATANGQAIGDHLSPERDRLFKMSYTEADKGIAYYDADAVPHLWDCNEVATDQKKCAS